VGDFFPCSQFSKDGFASSGSVCYDYLIVKFVVEKEVTKIEVAKQQLDIPAFEMLS
jgi:hypothetical protein